MDSNVLEILRRPEMGYMFREKNEANRERKGRKNYALLVFINYKEPGIYFSFTKGFPFLQ